MCALVFIDRSRKADRYPWLEWKVRLFVIGAALAVGGMVLDSGWVISAAILALAAGFAIRFLPGGKGVREEVEDEWWVTDEGWDGEDEGEESYSRK